MVGRQFPYEPAAENEVKRVMPEPKQAVSLRLDREVMEWFKRHGLA